MEGPAFPTVSVLMTTYNYGRFIACAVDSVLRQVYPADKLQVLVVDDGSNDETARVVRAYGDRVHYIAQDNGGQASALNRGFRAAEGEIVCLLDGDDYFYPEKVRRVAGAFRGHPNVGLVYDEFDIVDANGATMGKRFPEPTWTGHRLALSEVPRQLRSLILLGHPWTCVTSAMSIRRSLLNNLEIPEDVFPHSPDLFLGLVLPFMSNVAIVPEVSTAYVYHGANLGLFRSSPVNRAMYARQLDYIRRFVEETCGVRFLRYAGRSVYGPADKMQCGNGRFSGFIDEWRQIVGADVDHRVKWHSQARLAASAILPNALYRALGTLKAKHDALQSPELRRRIAFVSGGKETAFD
jgi:glycosyltransferase involved in cell wall biosynthesis